MTREERRANRKARSISWEYIVWYVQQQNDGRQVFARLIFDTGGLATEDGQDLTTEDHVLLTEE